MAYFFLFLSGITVVAILLGENIPILDWMGFGLFSDSMGEAARIVYPAYNGGFMLSMAPNKGELLTFYWSGIAWTLPVILTRMTTYGLSLGIVLLSAVFFDRFDSSKACPRARKKLASDPLGPAVLSLSKNAPEPAADSRPAAQLSPLSPTGSGFRFGTLYLAELRMLLKGQPWWWYLAAFGSIVASFITPLEALRNSLLPAALIWPTLIWSGLGCRETRHFTRQVVFSAPRSLLDQLPAAWLAGFTVAALMGVGVGFRFVLAGELPSLYSLFAGLLFIPSLALMLGVWTGSSKSFEVVYTLLWYLGALNKVLELDYFGIHTFDYRNFYFLLSVTLLLLAWIGRKRQIQSA